jgi:hypothetical protein
MGEAPKDFLDREEVQRALDDLFDEWDARYEAADAQLPDPGAFLRERDIEPPAGMALQLSREVRRGEDEGDLQKPAVIIDPGTGDWCYRRCVLKNGELVCHMVCA